MDTMIDVWTSGGWIMIPLFGLAVLLYSQAFGLLITARRAQLESASAAKWYDWVRKPANAEGRVREIIEYTQQETKTVDEVRMIELHSGVDHRDEDPRPPGGRPSLGNPAETKRELLGLERIGEGSASGGGRGDG